MSGRIHMVTHIGGHTPREGGGMSVHSVATAIRSYVSENWDVAIFGHLGLPWVPWTPASNKSNKSTPERRLAHLVELADQRLRVISGGASRLRLDHADLPRAILLTRANALVESMLVTWDRRLLKVDGAHFSLATPEVSQAVLTCVATRCGARMGSH